MTWADQDDDDDDDDDDDEADEDAVVVDSSGWCSCDSLGCTNFKCLSVFECLAKLFLATSHPHSQVYFFWA